MSMKQQNALIASIRQIVPDITQEDADQITAEIVPYFSPVTMTLLGENVLIFIIKEYLEKNIPPVETIITQIVALTNLNDDRMQLVAGKQLVSLMAFSRSSSDQDIKNKVKN